MAFGICRMKHRGLRWERDSCADATSALLLGQIKRVVAGARGTAKGVLLHVREASVAELLLLASLRAEHGVADDHAEALSFLELATSRDSAH